MNSLSFHKYSKKISNEYYDTNNMSDKLFQQIINHITKYIGRKYKFGYYVFNLIVVISVLVIWLLNMNGIYIEFISVVYLVFILLYDKYVKYQSKHIKRKIKNAFSKYNIDKSNIYDLIIGEKILYIKQGCIVIEEHYNEAD